MFANNYCTQCICVWEKLNYPVITTPNTSKPPDIEIFTQSISRNFLQDVKLLETNIATMLQMMENVILTVGIVAYQIKTLNIANFAYVTLINLQVIIFKNRVKFQKNQ